MPARIAFFLRILHHHNELVVAIRLHIIFGHICAQGHLVDGMKPPTVGIEEGHDVEGCDLCVKGYGVFQVIVPNFVDNVTEKFDNAPLSRLVTGIVIKSGFMGSIRMNANDQRGVIGNQLVVEWETSRAYKFGTMVGFILDGLSEDSHEGVNPVQLVVGDDHEKGQKGLPNGKQVIVGQLPFEGGEESWASLKRQVITLGIILVDCWFHLA
jgi:hypothetical protein